MTRSATAARIYRHVVSDVDVDIDVVREATHGKKGGFLSVEDILISGA